MRASGCALSQDQDSDERVKKVLAGGTSCRVRASYQRITDPIAGSALSNQLVLRSCCRIPVALLASVSRTSLLLSAPGFSSSELRVFTLRPSWFLSPDGLRCKGCLVGPRLSILSNDKL